MRHTFLTVLLLVLYSAISAQSVKKADKEFELGAFSQAANSYLKIVEKDPNDVHALTKMGDCFRILNRMEEAKSYYTRAIQAGNAGGEVYFKLGKVYKSLGEYKEAINAFDRFSTNDRVIAKHFIVGCEFAEEMISSPSPFKVSAEFFNSADSDFGLANFNEQMIISRIESPATTGGGSQIMISSLDQNNFLKTPDQIGSSLNLSTGIGPISYAMNNTLVLLTKNKFAPNNSFTSETLNEISLHYATASGDGSWQETKPFPFNGSGYSTGFPTLSEDGKTLFFASDRPDGYGGWDIYISRRIGETWTRPENLGPFVNTAGNEISPFCNGDELFFSSDWHHGLGGFDAFKATKSHGEWKNIYHLGSGINSSYDDIGYVVNPMTNIGYIASNRIGGKGGYDIYRVLRQTDQLSIQVSDSKGRPIEQAIVDMTNCEEGSFRTNVDGIYSFEALSGFSCDATVSKDGFEPVFVELVSTGMSKKRTIDVVLEFAPQKLSGLVKNITNNSGEKEVLIKATDQNSGASIESYSSADGTYQLALKANTVYVIRYSKMGFSDAHARINTMDGMSNDLLKPVDLEPVYATIPKKNITTSSTKDSASSTSTGNSNSSGFAVQLGASNSANPVNLEDYRMLAGIGKIYKVNEGGLTKIRLGNFKSKAAANVAKKAIIRQGFEGVFVVGNAPNSTAAVAPVVNNTPIARPKTVATVTSVPTPTSKSSSAGVSGPPSTSGKYKVRLATYKNTAYFKPGKILKYGVVEKRKKGDLTIMLLAAYDTLEEAKQVMAKVRTSGFKTAHVVLDNNGELIRQR